jgi:hypothetical protein
METPEEKEKQQQPGFFSKYVRISTLLLIYLLTVQWYFIVSVVVMMVFNGVVSQMGGPDPTAGAQATRRR